MVQLETAYLGLGTNLGHREAMLREALSRLGSQLCLLNCSSIYETDPWGYTAQPKFLNMVCAVATALSPEDLLVFVKDIERVMGRKGSTQPYGPRLIDIDILLYGDLSLSIPGLSIPHPKLSERFFVLVPLEEINSKVLHPVLSRNARELLKFLNYDGKIQLWGPSPC